MAPRGQHGLSSNRADPRGQRRVEQSQAEPAQRDDTLIAQPGSLDALRDLPAPDAIGHRVVHGAAEFADPVRMDNEVEKRIRALTALASLHQPKSLHGIDLVRAALPDLPEVACFDTP
jgi:acetate kinase